MTIYVVLFNVTHVLLRISVLLYTCISVIKRTGRYYLGLLVRRRREHAFFQEEKKIISEIPLHVGLLIAEDRISYDDICKVVVWCLALGIHCISIFDYRGTLKKNHSIGVIYKQIEAKHQELTGTAQHIYVYMHHVNDVSVKKNGINGTSTSYPPASNLYASGDNIALNEIKYRVKDPNDVWQDIVDKKQKGYTADSAILSIISIEDGLNDIAHTAEQLCMEVSWRDPTSISTCLLQEKLNGTKGLPDPELVIRFGHVSSTFGYLPWQIRLSEIIPLATHSQVAYEDFRNVLVRFCRCEKRFGK